MLQGLCSVRIAEPLAIGNAVENSFAEMEGKEIVYIFTDTMNVVRESRKSSTKSL